MLSRHGDAAARGFAADHRDILCHTLFKDVVADCLSGHSPDLLKAVDTCGGVTTCVAIPAATRCSRQRPKTVAQR
ncbi:MAG: hypothetical protein AB7N91_29335 [Candidatus Tectimicrobiota bacterium]